MTREKFNKVKNAVIRAENARVTGRGTNLRIDWKMGEWRAHFENHSPVLRNKISGYTYRLNGVSVTARTR